MGSGTPESAPASVSRPDLPALWREVRRFARGVLGSDAYDKYLTHHRVTGCSHPPMSEKEFWRAKYAEEDANPRGRCC
ncbi:YbdD/YjiX family protein [Brachybacterium sp. EF45031]|nr:YbdD/YjiX family protein [Brachybacterium sillae]